MDRNFQLSIFSLVVVILLLQSCATQQPPEQAGQTEERQQAQEKAMDKNERVDAPKQEQGRDAKTTYRSILAAQSTLQYKADYSMELDADGQTSSSSVTQFVKGIEMLRMDVEQDGVQVRTIKQDNDFYSCFNMQGSWTCQKSTYQPSVSDQATEDIRENVESYDVEFIGTATIADVQTSCYRVTIDDGTVEYCYSADYVPLLIKTATDQGTSTMTATSYSRSVSDSDFEVPANAGSMPGLPEGIPYP